MELKIEYVPIGSITPYAGNAKLHPKEQIDQIKRSIQLLGFDDPIAVWQNNEIIEGHGRLLAAQQLGMSEVPIIRLDDLTDEQRRAYALIHNKLTMNSGFDMDILEVELAHIGEIDMEQFDFSIDPVDFGESENKKPNTGEQGSLARDFVIPPFSVFDTRSGSWLERKRAWREIIKDDATTRGTAQLMEGSHLDNYEGQGGMAMNSLLDPVLSEIVLEWFMPIDGRNVFDTFAGDTVFGFVAGYKGNHFTGIELRKEQADFNNECVSEYGLDALYICDDGRNVEKHIAAESQDLFFSCPPYFDLEVYSDLPNDASNQKTYEDFYKILDAAFRSACKCLKNNRFAVIVASDVRGKDGGYYDFISDIKHTFTDCGLKLYNEIVLINSVGSGAFRARKSMRRRKVVRLHQEVLIFFKGDQNSILNDFGEVEVPDIEGEDE